MPKAASREIWDVPIGVDGFCGDVFATQRRLRGRLLDVASIRYAPARDLAAHMLLHLDDLPGSWSLATHWLRAELGCQRVDTGFGVQLARDYFPGYAEAKNADFDVPSFGASVVDNRDIAMQAMWLEPRPLIFADIKQDRRINLRLRQRLSGARTKSKFAGALRTASGSFGLICADWTEHFVPQNSDLYDCFEQTVADVLSPIIAVAKDISDRARAQWNPHWSGGQPPPPALRLSATDLQTKLTRSEIEVASLVARGLSYKEIARLRGKSFSTIDHQLRSIRSKTGVSSTSALISLLSKVDL